MLSHVGPKKSKAVNFLEMILWCPPSMKSGHMDFTKLPKESLAFLEDSKLILNYYDLSIDSLDQARADWSEGDVIDSYQYLEGLSFHVECDGIFIQETTTRPLILFLAMKNSINIQNIEAYQLAPTEGDPSFWRLMGTDLYPNIKPSDWIII